MRQAPEHRDIAGSPSTSRKSRRTLRSLAFELLESRIPFAADLGTTEVLYFDSLPSTLNAARSSATTGSQFSLEIDRAPAGSSATNDVVLRLTADQGLDQGFGNGFIIELASANNSFVVDGPANHGELDVISNQAYSHGHAQRIVVQPRLSETADSMAGVLLEVPMRVVDTVSPQVVVKVTAVDLRPPRSDSYGPLLQFSGLEASVSDSYTFDLRFARRDRGDVSSINPESHPTVPLPKPPIVSGGWTGSIGGDSGLGSIGLPPRPGVPPPSIGDPPAGDPPDFGAETPDSGITAFTARDVSNRSDSQPSPFFLVPDGTWNPHRTLLLSSNRSARSSALADNSLLRERRAGDLLSSTNHLNGSGDNIASKLRTRGLLQSRLLRGAQKEAAARDSIRESMSTEVSILAMDADEVDAALAEWRKQFDEKDPSESDEDGSAAE